MKKVGSFVIGGIVSTLLLACIALVGAVILLASGIELDINNIFVIIYSNGKRANLYFKEIPTIIAFVIGGIAWVKLKSKDNKEIKNEEK